MQFNFIRHLKKKLAYDLDEKNYYKLFNFKPHIVKKTELQNILLEKNDINSHIEKYLTKYFNINIMIIDLINELNYYICEYNSDILTIILFKINDNYEPIL